MSGILYGIGAGPGDPELITVKGLRLLREAGVIFVPATRPGESYARQIVVEYLEPDRQQVVELVCPAYRERQQIERRWAELAELVAQRLAGDANGVFVSEGDPSLYSTFQYLAAALRRDHPSIRVETVPGVSSVSAAAAFAGLPLALWDERLSILPAVHDRDALLDLLRQTDNAALLKVSGALDAALDAVQSLGGRVQVALVRRAGRPEQSILRDLAAMRAAQPDYFTTLLIRKEPHDR